MVDVKDGWDRGKNTGEIGGPITMRIIAWHDGHARKKLRNPQARARRTPNSPGRIPDGAKGAGMTGGRREAIVEFHRVGNAVKVSAVDTATGVEVSIVGPAESGEETLKRTALRKLEYVLARGNKAR